MRPAVEPLAPRLGGRELGLDLVVLDDARPRAVSTRNILPGRRRPLRTMLARVDVEDADLAREHDEAVVGHEEAPGAQTVAVERRADEGAVGEDERRRAVPRLHEHAWYS